MYLLFVGIGDINWVYNCFKGWIGFVIWFFNMIIYFGLDFYEVVFVFDVFWVICIGVFFIIFVVCCYLMIKYFVLWFIKGVRKFKKDGYYLKILKYFYFIFWVS